LKHSLDTWKGLQIKKPSKAEALKMLVSAIKSG